MQSQITGAARALPWRGPGGRPGCARTEEQEPRPVPPATVGAVDQATARRLVADARFGVLATVTPEGRPHVVPCCFVLHGDRVYSAVDAKPKSTLALRRLDNVRANPAAALLVHHDAEDWSTLWWARVDGKGSVLDSEDERVRARQLLAAKYPQYRSSPPPGDVIALDIENWRWWP
jgi:PPOX class probable F420-dependent enzyme